MDEKKWYRVIDPLSPLCGCDVRGQGEFRHTYSGEEWLAISAIRRVDVFVGDRPFQRVAPDGQDLGLMVSVMQLEESPLQDEVVQLSTETPYGRCVSDVRLERDDGLTLHIVEFENMFQVALLDGEKSDDHPDGMRVIATYVVRKDQHIERAIPIHAEIADIRVSFRLGMIDAVGLKQRLMDLARGVE